MVEKVIRRNGEIEEFVPEKIRKICKKAGVDDDIIDVILERILEKPYEIIESAEIQEIILEELEESCPDAAEEYKKIRGIE